MHTHRGAPSSAQAVRRIRAVLAGALSVLALILGGATTAAAPRTGGAGPVLRTVTLGQTPWATALDDSLGTELIYDRGDASAVTVDISSGVVLARVSLGSDYNYAFSSVDTQTHHFFLSLLRNYQNGSGSNQAYMLDARTGKVVRALTGVREPGAVVVDATHHHVFVADSGRSSVLMYDTRDGVLLRAVPSCRATKMLALSARTGHLFVRCTDGTVYMHDAATGRILHRQQEYLSTAINGFDTNQGADASLTTDDATHRVLMSESVVGTTTLFDDRTGDPVGVLPLGGDFFPDPANGRLFYVPGSEDPITHPVPASFDLLDGTTGAWLHTFVLPGFNLWWVLVNPLTGHLLVTVSGPYVHAGTMPNGTLYVLDPKSGRVLRTITTGVAPYSLTIDRRDALLLLLNYGWTTTPAALSIYNARQL